MAETRNIAKSQNRDRNLTFLRAITVAHRHAQHAQGVTLVVSVLVAGLGMLTRPVPTAAPTVVLLGTAWAVFYATLVVPWTGRHLRTSATLQEMFDTELLDLPWNSVVVGDRIAEDDVSRFSSRFSGDIGALRDYYLVADVPPPYDVLFCLEQNLAWGSRVRRRFAGALIALVTAWFAAGLAVGVVIGTTVGQLVTQWLVPSLGLLLLCLDIYRAQVSISRERARVLGLLRTALDDPAPNVLLASSVTFTVFARQIQDVLFQMRRQQPRVPTWFFRSFEAGDMADFRFKMKALEARFANATQ